ncbi:hypothetical protein [Streptomyces sp. 1114.5]|nr:hypothetical protein [Streptomyces sp. 1114.5]
MATFVDRELAQRWHSYHKSRGAGLLSSEENRRRPRFWLLSVRGLTASWP